MFNRVLVGLDGSTLSEQSLPWVQRIAPRAKIVLGGAYTPIPMSTDPWMDVSPILESEEGPKRYLHRIAGGLRPTPRVVQGIGSPAGVLLELAQKEKCDLIAITSQGGTTLKRRLFGGTTENLLHHSSIPLLVIPDAGNVSRSVKSIRRIAIPLDGSTLAESILPWASQMARQHRAELLLVHCLIGKRQMVQLYESWGTPALSPGLAQDLEYKVTEYRRRLERHFKELGTRLRKQGLRIKIVWVTGSLPESIVKAARKQRADIIMMCAHGHGALRHLLQGSMVSRLIQASNVPVIVWRYDAKRGGGKVSQALFKANNAGL